MAGFEVITEELTEHLAHHVFRLSHLAKQKYVWASVSKTVDGIRGDKDAYPLISLSSGSGTGQVELMVNQRERKSEPLVSV